MTTGVSSTFLHDTLQPRCRIVQNYFVIWMDENIDTENRECQKAIARLNKVVKKVDVCRKSSECIQMLKNVDDGKAFVIISGVLGQDLLPSIHEMTCIDAVFIFCDKKSRYEVWAKEWSKIRGIFTSMKPLCRALKQIAHECDYNSISISYIPTVKITTSTTGQDIAKNLTPSFIFTMLFKELVLEIKENNAKSMEDLVNYCKDNKFPHYGLEEFQEDYYHRTPVWWYSSKIFLFGMINRAIRVSDMVSMAKLGFFVRHLHLQLGNLQQEQSTEFTKEFTVYRGQGLSSEDLKQLLHSKDGLLSFNAFLSTNKERNTATEFAERALKTKSDTAVLFIMNIDSDRTSSLKTPYAIIDSYSAVPQEHEILFSIQTIFKICGIRQTANNNQLWEVQLTLVDNNDSQLNTIRERMRVAFQGLTGWHRIGRLMYNLGDLSQAETLYNHLLNTTNDSDVARTHNMLGVIHKSKGEYKEAVEFFEKSLEIERKTVPDDHASLVSTYNNMGSIYENTCDYSKALEYYRKSLKIREKTLPRNHPDLAHSYHNIGSIYDHMGDYSKALEYYEKDLEVTKAALHPNHPHLATSYGNVGRVYNHMGDYSKALKYYEKDLEIAKIALPENHADLATSYGDIGAVYNNIGDYTKALEYYQKDLDITKKALPPTHPHVATCYNNIGGVYANIGDYWKALEYYDKDLEITKIALPPNHPHLATSYGNIGKVYNKMGDYSKALEYYQDALKIFETTLPPNHPDLATSYACIGMVYDSKRDYLKALTFLQKALDIRQKVFSTTHPLVQRAKDNIDCVRKKVNSS